MKKYFEEFNIDCGFSNRADGNSIDIRRAMADNARASGGLVVKANLVHGIDICIIDKSALTQKPYIEIEECDGLVTNLRNVSLTTTHGDCIPVFAYDPVKKVIGIAHAGWRGTADCVVSALIYWMCEEYKCKAKNIHAVVGPGIGTCCFEVDEDVADYFIEGMPWTEEYMCRKPDGKYLIDLKGINCELLEIEGVQAKNIFIDPDCTCCHDAKDQYFSYRRDKCEERMLAYIRM